MNRARTWGWAVGLLGALAGLAPEASADLLVSSRNNDSVLSYDDATGAFLGVRVSSGSGGLNDPRGLAIGPDGRLYVSSGQSDQVLRYDAATGAFIDVFVAAGSGGLDAPVDLTFGPDGNLYVASNLSDQVLRYNGATGAFIDDFATGAVPPLNQPLSLAFGLDSLYVTNLTGRFDRFDAATGAFINSVVEDNPSGLALGPDGNLYVGRQGPANEIVRYSQALAFLGGFVAHDDVTGPTDFAFGPDGNLYSISANGVNRYDGMTGAFIDAFVPAGSGGLDGAAFLVFTPQVIPEPGTLTTAAIGAMLGTLALARRRGKGVR